jgi:predicted esterase
MMPKSIILIFLCGIFFNSNSQGIQKEVPLGTNAAKFGYLEYLPPSYTTGSSFPLIVFFHGVGERGNGTTDLYLVAKNGPPRLIKDNQWPVKNPKGNYPSKEFIVISPQSSNGFPSPESVHEFINFIKSRYKVDKTRIYITGLSAGGITTWKYLATYNDQVAAAIPICGSPNGYISTLCTSKDTPIWAFHGDADGTVNVSGSINAIKTLRSCTPVGMGPHLLTIYNGVGHNSWAYTYNLGWLNDSKVDPNYDPFNISIYDWLLQYNYNNTLSTVAANQSPIVSAGLDKTVQLPTNSLVLSGTASDKDGTIEIQKWSKQSGPTVTLQNDYSANLTLTNLLQGTYVFRFWVKDNDGAAAYDDVIVTVLAGGDNQAPLVNAGADKTVQLPINSLVLSGTASDKDGTIEIQKWSKQSGPTVTLQNDYSANLTLTNLLQGTYVFRFWVKDNGGAAAYDDITVTVLPGGDNQAPLVNAGADKTVQLPINSLVLSGTASDKDGTIDVQKWSKLSGPTVTLQNDYSAILTLTNLLQGTYVFRFWAKDNGGAAAYDDVTVTVLPGGDNQAPLVNAGADKTVQLPTNSLVLSGTAIDKDGTIDVLRWVKQSGPTVTLQNDYSANLTLTNLVQGTYVFMFWAKDNDDAAAYDYITVSVQNNNTAPSVNAGSDKAIQLPINSIVLSGTASDPDGNIELYRWNQQSGPVVILENQYSANLTVKDLVQGTYVFMFWAKDNDGTAAYDYVTVSVLVAPSVNAGPDKTLQLPTNSLVLSGTASDKDGNIDVLRWVKQSGPFATLENQNSTKLTVKDLVQGTYVFRLFVKDDDGAAAYDDVTVSVQAATSSNNLGAQSKTSADNSANDDFNTLRNEIKVYPNPFKDKLTLIINGIENNPISDQTYFRLFDLMGNIVIEKELNDQNTFNFDLPELQNGMYIYLVTSNNRVLAKDRILKINTYQH